MDYSILYKSALTPTELEQQSAAWDVFLSAFNSSGRVQEVFARVQSKNKHWLICPEYGYSADEVPTGRHVFTYSVGEESQLIASYFEDGRVDPANCDFCVDITGFMRPHLLFLVAYLKFRGVRKFQALYSEPGRYSNKDATAFTDGPVEVVRPINGFEAQHNIDSSSDILVVGIGYDHELIKQVAEHKDYATIVPLFAFPSLRADMYQESILRASKAGESLFQRNWQQNAHYAAASDPFAVATELQDIVRANAARNAITNLYLSPLATKPQALGFALFHLLETHAQPTSVIFPFASRYARETSKGLSKIWSYCVELF